MSKWIRVDQEKELNHTYVGPETSRKHVARFRIGLLHIFRVPYAMKCVLERLWKLKVYCGGKKMLQLSFICCLF